MKSNSVLGLALLLFAAFFTAQAVGAENLAAVRQRMEKRLGAVDALKSKQIVGENNRGFLEVRGSAPGPAEQTVADENSDRRTVYAAIAAETGASPDAVGRKRAEQIASLAKRGHWVQDASGGWRRAGGRSDNRWRLANAAGLHVIIAIDAPMKQQSDPPINAFTPNAASTDR